MMVGEAMQAYWSTFAATDDPNHGDALEWPSFDADHNLRINFGEELSIVEDFRAEECAFWRAGYDAISEL
jgi:carboxylesterase type B